MPDADGWTDRREGRNIDLDWATFEAICMAEEWKFQADLDRFFSEMDRA